MKGKILSTVAGVYNVILEDKNIINITPSDNNLKEMIVVVNYIKQRGFKLVSLDTLLNEGVEEK